MTLVAFPLECEKCRHVWTVPFDHHRDAQACPACGFELPAAFWRPQAGPQFELVRSTEFEVLGGGQVFGGKTQALIYGGLYDVDNPHYRGLILRQSFPEIREIIDETMETFPRLGARWKESEKRWFFPSGATYEFGYCSSYKEALQYRGQQYSYIAFDEIGDLANAEKIWKFLTSRCRSTGPSIIPRMRASANPGGVAHGWLKRYFIVPCGRDGEVIFKSRAGLTRRFVRARATDNPVGLANNPQYMQQLEDLPELMRRQLLEGDWDAGSGTALEELSLEKHLVEPFPIPENWDHFGSFDWGFAHWWVFGSAVVNEDGRVYITKTLRGRRMLPKRIVEEIRDGEPQVDVLNPIVAGHDVKSDDKSRSDNTPTVKDSFLEEGIILSDANTARRAGLQRLREWVAWKGTMRDPATGKRSDGQPMLMWFDNPGNRRSILAIMEVATDEDDPNQAMKTDADAQTGEGGDDDYDMVRYLMCERIVPARTVEKATFNMNDPAQLAWEAEQQRRHYTHSVERRDRESKLVHPEMGTAY